MGQPPHIWFVYAQPAPALRDYVSGYHFVEVAPGEAGTIRDFNYPAWTLLRFTLGGRPWRAQVGGAWADVPSAALFGVTSRATPFASEGGLMVGAGLTPLGWARLFRADAAQFADRVVPFEVLAGDAATELRSRLRRETTEAGWTARFDEYFGGLLRAAPPLPVDVAAIHSMLLAPDGPSVETIAAALGLTTRQVNRIITRTFGLPPKLLIRRARFLRAALPLRQPDARPIPDRVRGDYPSYALFARDCRDFLGMTPAAYVASERPVADTSTRQRQRQLGAPAQGLHAPVAELRP